MLAQFGELLVVRQPLGDHLLLESAHSHRLGVEFGLLPFQRPFDFDEFGGLRRLFAFDFGLLVVERLAFGFDLPIQATRTDSQIAPDFAAFALTAFACAAIPLSRTSSFASLSLAWRRLAFSISTALFLRCVPFAPRASGNSISDVSALGSLESLTERYLDANLISDAVALSGLSPNLGGSR